jgi:hypothetical protein
MSTVDKKFYDLLQKNNVQLTSIGRGYELQASVKDLENLWLRGALEFIERPPVSIQEVLSVATSTQGSSEEWNKLRERVLKLGVITRG